MPDPRFLHRWKFLSSVAVLSVPFVCAFLLLTRSPCLGVADNLDFWRVMRPAGIDHVTPVDHPGAFVRCTFRVGSPDFGQGFSSSALLAWTSRSLWWVFSPADGLMDLRQVGLLYAVLLAFVMCGALAAGVRPLLVFLVSIVVTDPGYLLFFNSFYADSALFVALAGTVLWLSLRDGQKDGFLGRSWTVWVAGALPLIFLSTLGSASKMLYSTFALIVATTLAAPALCAARRDRLRPLALVGILLIIGIASPWHFSRGSGPHFPEVNAYHAVFAGIMKVSSHPERALDVLGIPSEYELMPRQDIFSAGIPRQHPVFAELSDVSRMRLAGLYLIEPRAMQAVSSEIMNELKAKAPHKRGSFTKSRQHPDRAQYQPMLSFSGVRHTVLKTIPVLSWLIPIGSLLWVVAAATRRSWNGLTTALFLLVLWFWSQMIAVILGDGLVSLRQHLLGARLAFDLQAVILLYVCACRIIKWWPQIRHTSQPA